MKTIKSLDYLAEMIENRIKNKFDLIITAEGKRGMGKSTFLYGLGKKLNNRKVIRFNPHKHLLYSRSDSLKVLANSLKCFIMNDEMINVAYNRDFWETDQKELIKALNNYRDSCNVFAMAIPKFIDLDKQMQRLCELRVVILKRGLAQIHQQLRGVYRSDVWDTKENIKIELKSKKGFAFGKLTTKVFYVKFPDLKKKERLFYEQLKTERRNLVFNANGSLPDDPMENLYKNLYEMITTFKMSQAEFEASCRVVGRSIKIVRNSINEKLKDNGLKERLQYYFAQTEKERAERHRKSKIKAKQIPIPQTSGEPSSSQDTVNNTLIRGNQSKDNWDGL
jgi:hypothetical protein